MHTVHTRSLFVFSLFLFKMVWCSDFVVDFVDPHYNHGLKVWEKWEIQTIFENHKKLEIYPGANFVSFSRLAPSLFGSSWNCLLFVSTDTSMIVGVNFVNCLGTESNKTITMINTFNWVQVFAIPTWIFHFSYVGSDFYFNPQYNNANDIIIWTVSSITHSVWNP